MIELQPADDFDPRHCPVFDGLEFGFGQPLTAVELENIVVRVGADVAGLAVVVELVERAGYRTAREDDEKDDCEKPESRHTRCIRRGEERSIAPAAGRTPTSRVQAASIARVR